MGLSPWLTVPPRLIWWRPLTVEEEFLLSYRKKKRNTMTRLQQELDKCREALGANHNKELSKVCGVAVSRVPAIDALTPIITALVEEINEKQLTIDIMTSDSAAAGKEIDRLQFDHDKPPGERSWCRGCTLPGDCHRLTEENTRLRAERKTDED